MIDRGERRVDQRIPFRTGALEPGDSLRCERQHGHCRSHDRRQVCGPPPALISWKRAATKPGCLLLTAGYARWPRSRSIRAPSRARWGRSIRSGLPRYMTRLPLRRNASPTRPIAAARGRRAHRWHRYREPTDAGAGFGEGGGDRRSCLHHCGGLTDRRSGLRSRHPRRKAAGPCVDRHHRRPRPMDGWRVVLQQHVGVGLSRPRARSR